MCTGSLADVMALFSLQQIVSVLITPFPLLLLLLLLLLLFLLLLLLLLLLLFFFFFFFFFFFSFFSSFFSPSLGPEYEVTGTIMPGSRLQNVTKLARNEIAGFSNRDALIIWEAPMMLIEMKQ